MKIKNLRDSQMFFATQNFQLLEDDMDQNHWNTWTFDYQLAYHFLKRHPYFAKKSHEGFYVVDAEVLNLSKMI